MMQVFSPIMQVFPKKAALPLPGGLANTRAMTALKIGTIAPEFSLQSTPDQRVALSELRGHPVVLVFYPADWSPVCGDQLALYNELREEFTKFDAVVLAISVDGVWCHAAFAKDRRYRFPLLSDFEPKGEVARLYGAYRDKEGFSERALFVIDGGGVIRWSYVSPVGINPGADGILNALEALPKHAAT
jgi:peroxiredoxin